MNDKITPTVIEFIPLSGVRLHIRPVNGAVVRAMVAKGESELPYPDPSPYMKQEEGAVPGTLTLAEDDPEYVKLCKAVDAKRNHRLNSALLDFCVSYPDFGSRDDLLNYFAPQREALRKVATLPDDNWEATRDYIILSGDKSRQLGSNDYADAISLCVQGVALTGGEIADGLRIFRPVLPGQSAGTVDRQPSGV